MISLVLNSGDSFGVRQSACRAQQRFQIGQPRNHKSS